MDQSSSYGLIAATRSKELGVRVGFAAFIALAALLLHPSWVPIAWFVPMAAGQLIDLRIARAVIARSTNLSTLLRRAYLVSSAVNATAWGAINIYLWVACGPPGQWFALMTTCGGLVHASLRLYPSRAMLYACGVPHAVYLLGLPLASGLLTPQPNFAVTAIILLGGLLFIQHTVGGARQMKAGLTSLREATAEAMRERVHAERASAAKSEFLATVSHEIRTPMNAVLSAAHLLKRTKLGAEQAEHVAMLTHAGDVLMSLLNDVLDISKIEAGRMEIESADLDLSEALSGLVALWEPQAQAKGVSLRLEAAADLPGRIRTDPLRLRQILFNLLSNAVKFTEAGEIVLRAALSGDGRLRFEVVDSGCGIDAEAQARLFTSFEQAHAGLSRRYGGTGLGLAISRRLAELMGGELGLAETTAAGSTFRLDLPQVAGEIAGPTGAAEADGEDAGPTRPLSILVAEDHEVNRRIVTMFLQPLGWRLTMVENGVEAVAAAGAEAFDVILMDMQMPLMNGVEAAQAIRDGGGPNAMTPVVALTANALGHHRDMWTAVGVEAFLTKPIDPRLLVATLAAAGARRPCGQPLAGRAA